MDIKSNFQDLRIVKNKSVESIFFQIPVSVAFQEKEKFTELCNRGVRQSYPECKVAIEFKSQMTME